MIEVVIYLFDVAQDELAGDDADLKPDILRSLAEELNERLNLAAETLSKLQGNGWSANLNGPALSLTHRDIESFGDAVAELRQLEVDLGGVVINRIS